MAWSQKAREAAIMARQLKRKAKPMDKTKKMYHGSPNTLKGNVLKGSSGFMKSAWSTNNLVYARKFAKGPKGRIAVVATSGLHRGRLSNKPGHDGSKGYGMLQMTDRPGRRNNMKKSIVQVSTRNQKVLKFLPRLGSSASRQRKVGG